MITNLNNDKQLVDKLKILFSCLDYTSLGNTDSKETIENLCADALRMKSESHGSLSVASVCVYPKFVSAAASMLRGSGIKVASVAGAFPSGQLPLELKLKEIEYAISAGADEIDFVVAKGELIKGNTLEVETEVKEAKSICSSALLKVIIESGDLADEGLIRLATRSAIENGADFVKTSTGKTQCGATIEAAKYMLEEITDFNKNIKKRVGFKASGGIKTVEQALLYLDLAMSHNQNKLFTNQMFRIGTSSLVPIVYSLLRV